MLPFISSSIFDESIFEKMFDFSDVSANPWGIIAIFAIIIAIGIGLFFLSRYMDKKRAIVRKTTTSELVLGAVCVATSFILSFIRILRLSNAGSVTLASVLPIAIYCYIFGFNKSMLVCFVFSLLNFIQGPYVTNVWGLFLDYLLPYLAISLVGIFAVNPNKFEKNSTVKNHGKFFIGIALYFIVRLLSHTLSGAIFWSSGVDFWIFQGDLAGMTAFLYSLCYNVTYVLPDTLVVVIVAFFMLNSKNINAIIYHTINKNIVKNEENISKIS